MTTDETLADVDALEEPEQAAMPGWCMPHETAMWMIPGRSVGVSYTTTDQGALYGGTPS